MAEREVTFVLGAKPAQGTGQAFDALSNKAKQLQADADKAGKAVAAVGNKGGPGGGVGAASGGAAASGGGGTFAAIAGGVGVAIAAVAGFAAVLDRATVALNAYGDVTNTAFQRQEAIASSIPLIGMAYKSVSEFGQALIGVTKLMSMITRDAAKAEVVSQAEFNRQTKVRASNLSMADLDAEASAARTISDRVKGDPRLQESLLSDKFGQQTQAQLAAERESLAAAAKAKESRRQEDLARRESDAANAAVERARAKVPDRDSIGSNPFMQLQYATRLFDLNKAISEQKRASERLDQASATAQGRTVEAAAKRAELEKAIGEATRARLQDLQGELKTAEGMATQFAKLRPWERSGAISAARRLERGGADRLSDFDRELLGKAGGGDALDKAFLKEGLGSQQFKDFMTATGQKTADALKKEIAQLRPVVAVEVNYNTQLIREAVRDAFAPYADKFHIKSKLDVKAAVDAFMAQQDLAGATRK